MKNVQFRVDKFGGDYSLKGPVFINFLMVFKKLILSSLLAALLQTNGPKEVESMEAGNFDHMVNKMGWVDSVFQTLDTEQKVGQLFMVAAYSGQGGGHQRDVLKMIEEQHVGGIIFMQGSPTKQAKWTNKFQAASNVPLFVATDGEWGLNMRLDSTLKWPRQLTLGALQDNDLVYQMGQYIGKEMSRVGVNINLAPVIDINNNPNNPVIGDRSFGEDKFNVALKGLAYVEGMRDQGVMACVKHFPGHGDTDKDSHHTLPTIPHSKDRLENIELFPFQILFSNGVGSVMSAHLHIPALDDKENVTASLSHNIINDLLIDSMGYEGLIITDALGMKGVTDQFKKGEIELMAYQAGNDILLMPQDLDKGIEAIMEAIEDGSIDEKELDKRVKKILAAKYDYGLSQLQPIKTDSIYHDLNNWDAKLFQQKLYEKAITMPANNNMLLPYKSLNNKTIASVSIGAGGETNFQRNLENYYPVGTYNIGYDAPWASYGFLADKVDSFNRVIIGLHQMSRSSSTNYGISQNALKFIDTLSKRCQVTVVLFGSPYALKLFKNQGSLLVAYEDNDISQAAAAQAIFGGITIEGTLPVTAGSKFGYGDGYLSEQVLRFKYTVPEEVGWKSKDLKLIDFIANEAIESGATPGCQVFIAKDGKVVFNKAYGYQTYDKEIPIDRQDVYDLASITKVGATVLSAMHLYSNGLLDLNKTVGDYIPDRKNSSVGGVKVKELLLHEAGLQGWIPFYTYTNVDSTYDMYYCDDTTGGFCVPVAEGLYLHEDYPKTMWNMIGKVNLKEDQGYKYSDLSMYLMKEIVESLTGKPLDEYVYNTFYGPMGLGRISYNPLEHGFKVKDIPPTEDDKIFRHRLVQGYVHDPGAAMLGGVGGHAGLFANAADLGAIMQMWLNGGQYGGSTFMQASTVSTWSKYQSSQSRRGFGFDKPNKSLGDGGPCSDDTPKSVFGHTGFTGTCAWADPDNNVVYVFLSNRVYPDANNWKLVNSGIRTRIQSVIYQTIANANAVGKQSLQGDATEADSSEVQASAN